MVIWRTSVVLLRAVGPKDSQKLAARYLERDVAVCPRAALVPLSEVADLYGWGPLIVGVHWTFRGWPGKRGRRPPWPAA